MRWLSILDRTLLVFVLILFAFCIVALIDMGIWLFTNL